ncbi:hypothetical protein [Roseibium sp. RKSG952]|uniref:hypothetical protein n=1 Tax=Roseibium sp. RKSG952 TaxID=2529384 RepID=UPI0012BCE104|nr:hypothetical protein [Roseibium sp. RKSG952]MTH96875.1 hypothetical protein [Roseibium sp. RKSG952]
MTSETPSLGRRIARLPGQFILALINATSILVIVAIVLVLMMLNRVETAGAQLASSVTDAAMSRLQVSPEDFRARLMSIDQKLDQLSSALENPGIADNNVLRQDLAALNRNITDLKVAAQGLTMAGPDVTEAALQQAGTVITNTLIGLRDCTPLPQTNTSETTPPSS